METNQEVKKVPLSVDERLSELETRTDYAIELSEKMLAMYSEIVEGIKALQESHNGDFEQMQTWGTEVARRLTQMQGAVTNLGLHLQVGVKLTPEQEEELKELVLEFKKQIQEKKLAENKL